MFLDAAPKFSGAVATLPSGQFVSRSEITAQLLADVEQGQTVNVPSWLRAMEVLAPVLLAIVATLFLPTRNRRDIILLCTITILAIILIESLFLLISRMRLDMSRASIILLGASILS